MRSSLSLIEIFETHIQDRKQISSILNYKTSPGLLNHKVPRKQGEKLSDVCVGEKVLREDFFLGLSTLRNGCRKK